MPRRLIIVSTAILLSVIALSILHRRRLQQLNVGLLMAVEHGDVQGVRNSIKRGASPNAQKFIKMPRDGMLAAFRSFFTGKEQNISGISVLQIAVEDDRREIVRLLLEKGANPEIRDTMDRTLLMRAAILGRTEIVESLIQTGANINARGYNNWTALTAVEQAKSWGGAEEHDKVIRILLKNGAKN